MKITNTFTEATVSNDLDERFTNGQLIGTPKNISVFTTDGSSLGVLKNVPGNVKKSDYANDVNYSYAGARTIGVGRNDSDEKIYHFVKATGFDYIIEFNTLTFQSTLVLGATTGGVLNFQDRITNVDIFIDAVSRDVILFWSGDANPPRCVNVETAKTWGIDAFTNDEISVMKPSPIFAPEINLTTSVDGVENNFIEDKMLCFAYRYKFSDGYYSAPSSWSKIAFTPRAFNLDYQTYENLGMLNLSNAVDIDFNTGGRDVVEVDLLFRQSNSTKIYVIEQFVKSEQGWADDSVESFQFSKSKIYDDLTDDQFFRNFDNVPLSAVAQTIIGNRIAYANFVEGRDLGVVIDFDVALVTEEPFSSEIEGESVDYDGATDYSNQIDFEQRTEISGSNPIDQMNFTTNTIAIDLAVTGSPNQAGVFTTIVPQSGFSLVEYTVTLKDGATVLQSFPGLSGTRTLSYTTGSNKNVQIYVTSDEGLVYDCNLSYRLFNITTDISTFLYQAYHQLSFPKSGGYGATLVGDIVIDEIAQFDMTGYQFTSGNQIRINLELQSSLVEGHSPSVTFFYNLTDNYINLADFLANSGFSYQLQTVFTETFKNNFQSGAGTFVSISPFVVSQSGNLLQVRTPLIVYNVTEPSGVIENKNEFYLVVSSNLQTVDQNAFTSLHSNRDYEVVLIYMDEQGRKTTALNSANNTIYIHADNSDLTNKLQVTINNNPPTWAKYYKFAIKQVKKDYDIIYGNKVYTDGIYRWIKLEGESKNKVNEGDLLTVKSDYSGALTEVRKVKVLEVVTQDANFISGNLLENGDELLEEAGTYFKIKQGDFNINVTQDAFKSYLGYGSRRYASRSFVTTEPLFGFYDDMNVWTPDEILSGTLINFKITIKRNFPPFNYELVIDKIAQDDYVDMQAFFTAEIENDPTFTDYVNNYVRDWQFTSPDSQSFQVKPDIDGNANNDVSTTIEFNVNFAGGTLVFETEPIEQLESPFFETPETFTITDGQHEFTDHLLDDAFNCFAFGNGVESYKVRDSMVGKSFSIDSNPTDINKEGYRQLNRFADITYSEIYNSNTNVNRLNEFNLSLANFKDDIEKVYGSIFKIKGKDTDLDVLQEDKISKVYYEKDLLFNADGTTNLTVANQQSDAPKVLGQQKTYPSENGISQHPQSYDDYGTNDYFTDVKRGVVIKKNDSNGLFPISDQGMRSYFKELFRDNTITHIRGQYDQYYDIYILNIQMNESDFVTWLYSDAQNGWLSTQDFNPEEMIRVNGNLYTFKNGEVYIHNQETDNGAPNYNKFYGESFDSEASFNFSQAPSERKNYKTIEIEGTIPVQIGLTTDLDQGYINVADFERKEGLYVAYTRYDNGVVNTELLSYQGIGEATISGLTLNFDFEIDPIVSVGDVVLNDTLQIVGTILSKTANSLTLDAVNNIVSGDFVLASKPKSVQQQGLLGYYCKVDMSFASNERQEIFALSSEVFKSFM